MAIEPPATGVGTHDVATDGPCAREKAIALVGLSLA